MADKSMNSPFGQILEAWPEARLRALIGRATPDDVSRALARETCHPEDLAALLSPQAAPRLEDICYYILYPSRHCIYESKPPRNMCFDLTMESPAIFMESRETDLAVPGPAPAV